MDERDARQLQFLGTAAYWAAVAGVLYVLLRYVAAWLLPFLLGVTIAALLRPTALRLAKRLHIKEKTAAVLTLTLFYLLAAGLAVLFFTILLAQLYDLTAQFPTLYVTHIEPVLTRLSDWFYALVGRMPGGTDTAAFTAAVSEALRQAAVDGSTKLVSWAAGLAGKLPLILLACVFTITISVLTATGYRTVATFLRKLVPKQFAGRLGELQSFVRETVWQYVRAYTIIFAVTFSELAVGLWLLRFEYALPVAAVVALLDALPLIGSGIVLVPWGTLLLLGGDTAAGIGLLCLFGVIAVVRNVIEPRVVGRQTGLHPIATITAMYAGLRIAGVAGMLAAPVCVLLALHIRTWFQ